MNTYQKIIHKSRYAKYIPSLERREEWFETVERYVGFFKEKFGKVFPEQLIRESILQTQVTPSMRGMMTAGEALRRDELAVFNCAYLPLSSTSDYRDLTYILMLGTGVGFSCESKFVNQFPQIENFNTNHTIGIKEALALSAEFTIEDSIPMYLVQDTKYGWAESNMYLLNCLLKGYVPNISYEKVRPKGARLVTFGGRASGPEPLKECHRKIIKLFSERQGYKLRSIDAHDIACYIAESIVVGGVRRLAMISLSDLEDKEMALSKHGEWWTFNQQRALANNSAVWNRPLTKNQFFQEWEMLKASGSGERGIFSRYGSIKNSKNRELDANCGTNPCVVGDTLIAVADGRGYVKISELAKEGKDVDVYTVKDGSLVIRKMRNPRITGYNSPVVKVEFTNGSWIKVTPNHKFVLKDGSKISAIDLKNTDEIESLSVKNHLRGFSKRCSLNKGYRNITFRSDTIQESRFLYGYYNNEELISGIEYNIHHINGNKLDNSKHNLKKLTVKNHSELHSKDKLGLNNPYHTSMTDEWMDKLKLESYGEANGNSLEISTKDIIERIKEYANNNIYVTKKDFNEFLVRNKIPVTFTRMRQLQSGFHPPHEIFNCFSIKNGRNTYGNFKAKTCEVCKNGFFTNKNEHCVCKSCSLNIKDDSIKLRSLQSKIYNDFISTYGRHPYDSEWKRIRYDNKFVDSFLDAKSYANEYNHRVKSVEYIQPEDVYNGTVEETHTYFAIGESVDDKMLFVLNANCGEIILRPYQTCNLSEVIIRPTDTKEDIRKKVEIATIIGTFQSCFDNFPYVNLEWERSQREDRLLGVSLTGIMQNGNTINPDVDFLEHLNKSAAIVNAEYADKLGIKRSAAITCIKPSGNVSQLCGTSSGIHPVYANRYIRRIRMDKKDPLTNFLVEQGLEFEEDVFNKENLIFPFYKEEEGVNRNDITAIGQLELYLKYKKHYTDHNVSNTIYVGDGEWVNVGNWVYNNQTEINGLSFLPRDNHTYVQAPYTEVSERSFVNNKEVDFSDFYEFEDLTTGSQEYACAGGACEIK